jgi:alpha-D-ribose 1-methylphosphonate 5-triphosphate synthase subunit PhnL
MGVTEKGARIEAEQALTHFELDEKLWDTYPNTFSGGEKLRLNIAMATVKKPRLLLLDEPTASLDQQSKIKVREIIEKLKANGTTLVGIFHDIEFMEGLCDKVYDMKARQLVWEAGIPNES